MSDIQIEMINTRLEELGLSFLSAGLESYLGESDRYDKPLIENISDLIDLEYHPRMERMIKTRLKVSGLPEIKRLEDFDLSWPKGGLTKAKFNELASLGFVQRRENVILMGPSGLGKTHLLLSLGNKACLTGYTAYYISCMDLLENLQKARENNRLKRKLKWFRKPHVLLIDEVGYENLSQEQAALFFQVVNARYEHGPIIMTTNKSFGKWGEIMSDAAVATATLDRLLHHAQIISLKGDSYRMKERLKIGAVGF